jgi:thiamine-phosphate pyrophosphorylase
MLRFAITDRRLIIPFGKRPEMGLVTHCANVAAQGVDYLLIREKDLSAAELVALSRDINNAVRAVNPATKILIARRADVALAVGADGVHLSAAPGELPPAQVRALMPAAFVSVSCHTRDEVLRARDARADIALFGPVFQKQVNGVEVVTGAGLQQLRDACVVAGGMKVLALGGVNLKNARLCIEAGANGVAGIRLFFAS